jgi:GH15 family glucan-1,4-alpha-glucosidase
VLDELGLIGNCQLSALVHRSGEIVWACMPRFDSPPVFARLLDPAGGGFAITPAGAESGVQRYLPNTNVLETRFDTQDGAFRILDFAPRFIQFDRSYRPTMLVRVVEPLHGAPRVKVTCRPVLGWTKRQPEREWGSHHISFGGYPAHVRLTTDAPLEYVDGESFALGQRRHFVLSWGPPVEEPLEDLCERFLRLTTRYWQTWVKHCDVPPIYQEEVIRSALALKLHCYEDTGAIVAALTTSLPEAPGSGRTWDYRYCWLRDAYYTLGAFRLLGHFDEREQFSQYLLNVASSAKDFELAPLYRVDGKSDLTENVLPHWEGYLGNGPVRVGNQAAEHRQNDVFGEMVLALAPLFLDARFRESVSQPVLDLLSALAKKAEKVAGDPDAGIWEYRGQWRPQTFTTLMCWAAADRMSRVAARHRPTEAAEHLAAANRVRELLLSKAVHPQRNCLVADFGGTEVDAALLQAVTLRLLEPSDPRMKATVDAVQADLGLSGWLRRYRTHDDFGVPTAAFMLCNFWLIEALVLTGRVDEGRALMRNVQAVKAPLSLLSEDVDPKTGVMWGNFPQAYSHGGVIHAAFAAAPRWTDVA